MKVQPKMILAASHNTELVKEVSRCELQVTQLWRNARSTTERRRTLWPAVDSNLNWTRCVVRLPSNTAEQVNSRVLIGNHDGSRCDLQVPQNEKQQWSHARTSRTLQVWTENIQPQVIIALSLRETDKSHPMNLLPALIFSLDLLLNLTARCLCACSVMQLIDHPPRTVQTPTMRSGGYGSIGRSSPKVRLFCFFYWTALRQIDC